MYELEMKGEIIIKIIHMIGMCLNELGTDVVRRGCLLEELVTGKDPIIMLLLALGVGGV